MDGKWYFLVLPFLPQTATHLAAGLRCLHCCIRALFCNRTRPFAVTNANNSVPFVPFRSPRSYNRETSTLAATVSPEAFDLSYWQKVSGTLQMGSSMIVNQRQNRALGTVCYRLEHEDTVIRGSFDSDWTVGFTYGRLVVVVASTEGQNKKKTLHCCASQKGSGPGGV